jgi:uncharacterized protein with ParB-like and HNH nuclease domain
MKTNTLSFRDLLQQDIRLLVPLYQRPYVWNEKEQWEPLWEDIRAIAEDLFHDRFRRPHFLGAIVLEQVSTGTGEIQKRLVIDGQQRLTTSQIVLEAFHDVCHELGADKPRQALDKMIRNDDPMADGPDEIFKVWPTTVDQEAFRFVMECHTASEVRDLLKSRKHLADRPIVQGYLYFNEVLREWIISEPEGSEKRITALVNALRDHMRFVVIDLEDEDDAQLIFETLNARGTPLLPTDLVKNFIFHRARLEKLELGALYKKYWEPFEQKDAWWRKSIGRGHAQRARIDLFLQAFLTVQTRELVSVSHVYAICRDHIIQSGEAAEPWLRQLRGYAETYEQFHHYPSGTPEHRFFATIEALDVVLVIPVALELFTRFGAQPKLLQPVLRDIESFLIRRTVCGLNTRGYNRFFIDLLGEIREADTLASDIRGFLLKSDAESTRWPDDAEFAAAWISNPIYKTLVRKRVKFLLECLESGLHTAKTETIVGNLNIEHLMPQNWAQHWPLPGVKPIEEETADRNTALHTIGNLTLLTTALNPAVSNGAWGKKRSEILKHSALCLNRDFNEEEGWDETTIRARAPMLFKTATKIWPYPKG